MMINLLYNLDLTDKYFLFIDSSHHIKSNRQFASSTLYFLYTLYELKSFYSLYIYTQ